MKSYVKVYGPPLVKTLHTLEKIAAESPEVMITGYFSTITPSIFHSSEAVLNRYFGSLPFDVPVKRRSQLISKSGHTLGDNDFFFEWARDPTWKELEDLILKIDEAITPLGCKYTIVTK